MSEFIQTLIIALALIGALGFLLFRLSKSGRALAINQAPCCHGEADAHAESACDHCVSGTKE